MTALSRVRSEGGVAALSCSKSASVIPPKPSAPTRRKSWRLEANVSIGLPYQTNNPTILPEPGVHAITSLMSGALSMLIFIGWPVVV